MKTINNEWQRFDQWDHQYFAGINFELKYPDGSIKKTRGIPSIWTQKDFDNAVTRYQNYPSKFWNQETMEESRSRIGKFWDIESDNTYIEAAETWVRMDPKKVEKLNKILSIVQIGDFVRFPSSRTYKWRKIISINWDSLNAYGQCCSKPNDETLAFHSSSNSLSTALEIVRNGKTIYPTKEK